MLTPFELQQEASRLQERIEQHLSSGALPVNEDSTVANQSPVDWLVEGLNSALGPLQEAGEEAELLAANISEQDMGDEIDYSLPTPPPSTTSGSPLRSRQRSSQREMTEYQPSDAGSSDLVFGQPDSVPLAQGQCELN